MIFVTAGTQLPFERLHAAVVLLAGHHPDVNFVYQAGPGGSGHDSLPENLEVADFYSPDEYERFVREALFVVTHAGMGNVITCIEKEKSFVMFPRLAANNEHRNNHQLDSAQAVSEITGIPFFIEEAELVDYLGRVLRGEERGRASYEGYKMARLSFAENLKLGISGLLCARKS